MPATSVRQPAARASGSVTSSTELCGKLEQRSGEGSRRGNGENATPTVHPSGLSSAAHGDRCSSSAGLCEKFFFAHFLCPVRVRPQCTRSLRSASSLRPLREAAGGRGVQPAFVLQYLMHSRLAGSRGDGVEGELKQRADEGPLRSDGDDAAPARHIGRTQSRPNGSVRTLSSRPRGEPEEGCGLGTDCKAAGGMRPSLGQQQHSGRGRQGGEMRLEPALVTSAGGVPLPASETVPWLVVDVCVRWLWGIPSGDVAALSSEVVGGLRCRCDGS